MINVGHEEPSWWVWVTEDMVPSNTEERSEIDNDNYVVVNEEQVVEGVANFMARCLVANPKSQVYRLTMKLLVVLLLMVDD